MNFRKQYLKIRDLVKVFNDISDERILRVFGRMDLMYSPDYWCVDLDSDDYLILMPPVGRDDSIWRHYLLRSNGRMIKMSCIDMARGEISFQEFPSDLEPFRSQIELKVANALIEYGYWGDGTFPIDARFVKDDITPPTL